MRVERRVLFLLLTAFAVWQPVTAAKPLLSEVKPWAEKVGCRDTNGISWIIWRDGKLACRQGPATGELRNVGAITRLFTALAAGLAAQDGLVAWNEMKTLVSAGDTDNTIPGLLRKASGRPLPAYLNSKVTFRIGIINWRASAASDGEMDGRDGLFMSLADLVKVGEFLRCGGRCGKKRILDDEAVRLPVRIAGDDGAYWFDGGNGVLLAVIPKDNAVLALAADGAGIQTTPPTDRHASSFGAKHEIFRTHAPEDGSSRNSEGDIIELKDGRLMVAWGRFTGTTSDTAHADIFRVFSPDGGQTWSDPELLFKKPEGTLNVMCVSFLRLADGDLAFACLVKRSVSDCRPVFMRSKDEGLTWSAPVFAIPDVYAGYYVVNNGRFVQLPSGRIVFPATLHGRAKGNVPTAPGGALMTWYSDDGGVSWKRSNTVLDTRDAKGEAIRTEEPGLVPMPDGRLLMYVRTDRGSQYFSWSCDGGETWTPAVPSSLVSPRSPAKLQMLTTGVLAAVWNDHEGHPEYLYEFPYHNGSRRPLTLGFSDDGGKTWKGRVNLETEGNSAYAFLLEREREGKLIIGYSIGRGMPLMRVISMPLPKHPCCGTRVGMPGETQPKTSEYVAKARQIYAASGQDHLPYTNTVATLWRWPDAESNDVPCTRFAECRTSNDVRWVNVPYARNVRDIGGWNGLRTGRVYRGSQLYRCTEKPDGISPATVTAFRDLDIATCLDLRSDAERSATTETICIGKLGVKEARARLSAYFGSFGGGHEAMREALLVFTKPENYPIYFHCKAGADRTGTLAFVLEGLCGVSEIDLAIDYELTTCCGKYGRRSRNADRYRNTEKRDCFWRMIETVKSYEGRTLCEKFANCAKHLWGLKDADIAAIRRELMPSASGHGKIDVVAVYYPHWHEYPKGNEWFHPGWTEWEFVKTPKTRFKGQINFKPLAGCLDGADPSDVETEIALASNAGITVFLYDYYWYNGQKTQEEAIEKGFLKAKNRDKMKFALMWCYHDRRDQFRPQPGKERRTLMSLAHTPEEFLGLIDYSIAHYFNQPQYWRKDGKLFFSIFGFTSLWKKWGEDDAKVREAIAEARRRVRVAGLGELHVNAQGVSPQMMERMAALGLDSFTDYGFSVSRLKGWTQRVKAGETCFDYGELNGTIQRFWEERRKASPIPYIPIVPTGWDSTLRCRTDVPFPWKDVTVYPYTSTFTNNTDVLFEKYLRDAKESVSADAKKPGAVYVNAWNEYTEGCWLLPDCRRGDLKLRAVARVFGRQPAGTFVYTERRRNWRQDSKGPRHEAKTVSLPDIENVKYGPHERQGMDVWFPKKGTKKEKTPIVIVFHGGGWSGGDRMPAGAAWLDICRRRGFALATVGYRFIADATDQGIKPPVRAPLDDAVAAVRFVKAHAYEWNIDVARIGLTGGSAGACSSLYCALMGGNELGIRAVFVEVPQTSLDPKEMKEWIPNIRYGNGAFGYRTFDDWLTHRAECLTWIEMFSPAALLRNCPPKHSAAIFYRANPLPPDGELPKDPTHAGMFCVRFAELCKEKGVFCQSGNREEFVTKLM